MKKRILIKGGYLVDPDTRREGLFDILIEDGVIARVGEEISDPAEEVIDASGLTVLPGIIDMHVHLRDPGQTHKEDLATGTEAAARGGVTALVAMANTNPPMDSVNRIDYVRNKAGTMTKVRVLQASAITLGMQGEELVNIEGLASAGVNIFSEDGKSVMNAALMREAMLRIRQCGGIILDHTEDIALAKGGVMNDDDNAVRLNLPGIPNSAEDAITARDCILAKETGVRLHICHCSTENSVKILRDARRDGVNVSAEVCPHHFLLTSDDIPCDDANYKMNPPLRRRQDVDALIEGLLDGTIECISTDHAPHSADEKSRGFRRAPFGIVGLETSVALTYTGLVKTGILTLMQMAEKMSANPARILGIPGGSLAEGARADLAVFDFEHPYRIDPEDFFSKGRNTPFAGKEVYGKTMLTVADGGMIFHSAPKRKMGEKKR